MRIMSNIDARKWKRPSPEKLASLIALIGAKSQSDLAARLGYKDRRAVQKWLSGETEIPFCTWYVIKAMAEENSSRALLD